MKWSLPLLFLSLLLPGTVNAQVSSQLVGPGLNLVLEPAVPKPNETVRVSIDDYSINTAGRTLLWFINDEQQPELTGQRSIEVTVGGLGETTTISASMVKSDGPTFSATRVIIPAVVDIIVEPQTYAPDFYRGRPLPSVHGLVNLTAIADTGREEQGLSYQWKLAGRVMGGGPQQTNKFSFYAPMGRDMVVSVDVFNNQGLVIARRGVVLPIAKPKLLFYEVNALKGTVEKPIEGQLSLIGNETTLLAAPYNLGLGILAGGNRLWEWYLNGDAVLYDPVHPLEFSILREDLVNGSAELGIHIRDLDDLSQGVRGGLIINSN